MASGSKLADRSIEDNPSPTPSTLSECASSATVTASMVRRALGDLSERITDYTDKDNGEIRDTFAMFDTRISDACERIADLKRAFDAALAARDERAEIARQQQQTQIDALRSQVHALDQRLQALEKKQCKRRHSNGDNDDSGGGGSGTSTRQQARVRRKRPSPSLQVENAPSSPQI